VDHAVMSEIECDKNSCCGTNVCERYDVSYTSSVIRPKSLSYFPLKAIWRHRLLYKSETKSNMAIIFKISYIQPLVFRLKMIILII